MLLVGAVDPESIAQSFGGLFGKDATFSGRTYIWAELLPEIPKHLWFGFGFNSFWPGGVDGPAAEIIHRLEWNVPNGHNAYLDMINEQGLVGFGLFICFLVEHIRAIRRVGQFDRPRAAMHMSLIVYIILANLTEVGWFHPIMITHVVAMFSSANVSRLLFERRLQTLKDSAAARRPDPAAGGSDAEIPAGSAARLAAWK
jgi:O-antigen ligase